MLLYLPRNREWEEQVAREVEHQARIEAAFDRAHAFDRLGEYEKALVRLDEADALSGGLPPEYRAKRARIVRELSSRDASAERAEA